MTDARVSRKVVRLVTTRADFHCEYCWCWARICPGGFHVEHIIPRTSGGTNTPSNLCYACAACNGSKHTTTSAVDSKTNRTVRLYHPRRDHWSDHFAWSKDLCEVVPLTAIGRATLNKLNLNRPEAAEHRRILRDRGQHPLTTTLKPERGSKH